MESTPYMHKVVSSTAKYEEEIENTANKFCRYQVVEAIEI